MAATWLRFPVWRKLFRGEDLLEWHIPLEIRTSGGAFVSPDFLVDTGSGLTTIPIAEAELHRIPFDRTRPVAVRGSTGDTGQGFIAPMWFSLAGLPEYEFQSL
jgi:hypothetical protein